MSRSGFMKANNYYSKDRYEAFQVIGADEPSGSCSLIYKSWGAPDLVGLDGSFNFNKDAQVTELRFTARGVKFELEAPYKDGEPDFYEWKGKRIRPDNSHGEAYFKGEYARSYVQNWDGRIELELGPK
ncbi:MULTISPECIES: hypothetical protein [Pseudomonas fluorescens group]|uniref:Uncharacterized protein n=1 Tax=Pseudomonas fluorescens TaxID=294 RepID=A0A0D0TKP5_PSEFL|nr:MULTISPECIES: hypothetical protein [Pseudomonas fluorescens group]AZE64009.1 hypothetical protein C4K02_5695 [Pseudomonas synxantha]KIR23756.1 hypothetical protein PFLU3_07300 [Pseudomonas fluorescens]